MLELFHDHPQAVHATMEIAERCSFELPMGTYHMPEFQVPQGETRESVLEHDAWSGLRSRLGMAPDEPFSEAQAPYVKRLEHELGVVSQMGFAGYFLIVADFIGWAKQHGIPVGPGRGSSAGSLAAWSLGITGVDPIEYDIIFERFLNPERVSMPDIDVDFCMRGRDEVIRYVAGKYDEPGRGDEGRRVSQIITFGTLQARAAIRDVGRVMGLSYGDVDRIAKLVPETLGITLGEAVAQSPELRARAESDGQVARLLETARKLEGLTRHASTHAAGVVIGNEPLIDLVPLYRDSRTGDVLTQYDWRCVEKVGLIKFDFLGLRTLTLIADAEKHIRASGLADFSAERVPLDDEAAYDLLTSGDTEGVFQMESAGMTDLVTKLKPRSFKEVIPLIALYRPGPLGSGMVTDYVARKNGVTRVEYLVPQLEELLNETLGVIVYQDQVLQIANRLAGYTLGEADLLRRAMGKKDKAEMAKQQARFVEGAMQNGVKKADAVYIFELVDKFAGYGFNKSHAAAYAVVSYHTAYLKANFREEFLAASMTLDMANTDKLAMFASEARKSGITVLPPCVNASDVEFLAEAPAAGAAHGAIRYALAALKNIGEAAVATVVKERAENGRYKDLADFARRINPKAFNKRGLETLAMSGSFDGLEPNRAYVHGNVEHIMALSQRLEADATAGTSDLFGLGVEPQGLDMRPVKAWTPMERLQQEFAAIGFYLSGHPLDAYETILPKLGVQRYTEFEARAGLTATAGRLAAIVVASRERRSQKGNKFAFTAFSDASGQFEAVIFSDTLARCRDLLEAGTPVVLSVEAERDGETVKLRVQSMEALEAAAASVQRGLKLVLDRRLIEAGNDQLIEIKKTLRPGGKGEVQFVVPLGERDIEITLPGRYEVSPMQMGELSTLPGILEVIEM
jgi:DNA polymerase-3 subunit alpha